MAAATDRQHYALQTIFSFFLGLMVLAFVGVGVNTFYPQPAETNQKAHAGDLAQDGGAQRQDLQSEPDRDRAGGR